MVGRVRSSAATWGHHERPAQHMLTLMLLSRYQSELGRRQSLGDVQYDHRKFFEWMLFFLFERLSQADTNLDFGIDATFNLPNLLSPPAEMPSIARIIAGCVQAGHLAPAGTVYANNYRLTAEGAEALRNWTEATKTISDGTGRQVSRDSVTSIVDGLVQEWIGRSPQQYRENFPPLLARAQIDGRASLFKTMFKMRDRERWEAYFDGYRRRSPRLGRTR